MQPRHSVSKKYTYAKVLFPTLITMLLFIVALFWVVIPQFENIILDRKREMIRELSYSAVSMIDNWRRMENSGELTLQQAQESAIRQLQTLRYGEESKDYFWVTDMHPKMVVHPYRPELNGKDLSGFVDSHQKKLFVEMTRVVKTQGEGFVDYMWQWKDDSTRIVPKLSFVKEYAPWGWIVGTGIYIEDVREEMERLAKKIITISILITILSSLFLFYLAFQNYQSERKRRIAEDELSESREKYRMLVEASGEGLIMILENRQVFYNKAIYAMLGYEESAVPIALSRIFRTMPDSKTFDFSNLRKRNGSETTEQFETELIKQNGDTLNAFLMISPINVLNNSGVVISVKDISRHKEMEEALGYSKEKYLALTNQLTIGVFRAQPDREARFTEVNPALKNILGVHQDKEILASSLFDFFSDPALAESVKYSLWTEGFVNNTTAPLKKSDGTVLTVSLSAVMIRDGHGHLVSLDGIVEDISEQRKTDKDREKLLVDLHTLVLMLSQRVQGFVKELYSCAHTAPIRDAVKIMTRHDSNAVLIVGDNGEELGFLTDRDIRERVVSSSQSLDEPVYKVMSSPIYSIGAKATLHEALVNFRKKKIRRLVVRKADHSIAGLLTMDELFAASYNNFLFYIKNIEAADQVKKIVDYKDQLLLLVRGLIEYDANVHSTTTFITLISDAITKRIVELAIDETGPPPASFAFITMGSEGREEQTLATDQDNAIIYADVAAETEQEVSRYFNRLGEKICDYLAMAGYRYCKGEMMAKNKKWCQPYSVWKRYFTDWITTSSPQDLLDIKIFFDFRNVYGDENLTGQLHRHIEHVTASFETFFIYMVESLLSHSIPDAMLKLKAPIDLKMLLLPVVDFVRLYSIKHKLQETNTVRRLEALLDRGVLNPGVVKSVSYCYNFLMQLRFKHQKERHDQNAAIDNMINPQSLTDIEAILFKRHYAVLEDLRHIMSVDFKGTKIK